MQSIIFNDRILLLDEHDKSGPISFVKIWIFVFGHSAIKCKGFITLIYELNDSKMAKV